MRRNIKTISPEEDTLVRLVRDEPLGPVLNSCDPGQLSKMAVHHKVIWLLAVRILSETDINARWRRWAVAAALSSERDARRCAKATRNAVDLLASYGISAIVLKGLSLAFGKPRDCGDVDLLIPEEFLERAIEVLESAEYIYRGFERNPHIRRGENRVWEKLATWANQFEFTDPRTGVLVELHTAFFETGRTYSEDLSVLKAAIGDFVSASVEDTEAGYRFLALEDRALLLALHASLKRSPAEKSFVLRHLTDFRALVGAGLDFEKLKQRALRFGVLYHLVFFLRLSEAVLGPCVPRGYIESLESGLTPRVVRLIRLHLRCLKSVDSYDTIAAFQYNLRVPFVLNGTPRAKARSLLVLPVLLPSPYKLATIYGLPTRSRLTAFLYVLEPLRAVYQLTRKAARILDVV